MLFFKKLKFSAMNSSNLLKYLGYAIGEIILIVVGINIALYFDNANVEKQSQEELNNIYELIYQELCNDTAGINKSLENVKDKNPFFQKILNESLTREELDTSIGYKGLILTTVPVAFQNRGYNLLIENDTYKKNYNDSLNIKLSKHYTLYTAAVEKTQKDISQDIIKTQDDWKRKYNWFHDLQSNPAYYDYITESEEYRNYVFNFYVLVSWNYRDALDEVSKSSEKLIKELKNRKK